MILATQSNIEYGRVRHVLNFQKLAFNNIVWEAGVGVRHVPNSNYFEFTTIHTERGGLDIYLTPNACN